MTKNNNLLGSFELTGIPPAPRGIPQIEVSFEIDVNGILQVSAEDKGTGHKNKIVIENSLTRLTDEEIERFIKDAERYEEEDKKIRENADAKSDLESYAYSLRNQIKDNEKLGGKLSADDNTTIEHALEETIKWLETNQSAETEEYREQKAELERTVQPIIKHLYEQSGGHTSHEDL